MSQQMEQPEETESTESTQTAEPNFNLEPEDNVFKDTIRATQEVITEGVMQITPNGINMIAADPAMVCMVDWHIPKERFNTFQVDGMEQADTPDYTVDELDTMEYNDLRSIASEHNIDTGQNPSQDELVAAIMDKVKQADDEVDPINVGVNFETLYSLLKQVDKEKQLYLNDDRTELVIKDSNGTFNLDLLNLDNSDIPSTNDLEYPFRASVNRVDLKDVLDGANAVADSVALKADGDTVEADAEGDQSSMEDYELKTSAVHEEGQARSMFSLDYLNKIHTSLKRIDGKNVEINLGEDFPTRIEYSTRHGYEFAFILAPRIEEE